MKKTIKSILKVGPLLIALAGLWLPTSTLAGPPAFSCPAVHGPVKTVTELLAVSTRPTIDEVIRIMHTPEAEALMKKNVRPNEPILMRTYFEAVRELLKVSNGRTVYLFARDGEWIHDAIQVILRQHPKGAEVSDRFKLINVSRLIARNHTPEQLQNFLRANGMNLERILKGEEKVLWVDTGNRGSIYLNLYDAVLKLIDFSRPTSEVNAQIANMITGLEGILIASREAGNDKKIIQDVTSRAWSNAAQVAQYLTTNLYFNEYLVAKRAELGIPEGRYERYKWVVENIEHTPHFHGRASKLNASGSQIIAFEEDAFAVKTDSLGLQLRIVTNLSTPESQQAFQSDLENLLGKIPVRAEPALKAVPDVPAELKAEKKPEVSPAEEKPKSATLKADAKKSIPLGKLVISELKGGEWIETPAGRQLQYLKPGGDGRRGIVLQVRNEAGQIFALKIAKNLEVETIESFKEEVSKAKQAEKAGFRVSQIYESGKTYHLKEWIEGPLAKDWVANWAANGHRRDDPGLIALRKVLKESARRGLYTGDLNRKNLIWVGEWIVIDSGSTSDRYTPAEAWQRYTENISSRWTKEVGTATGFYLKQALEE